MDKLTLLSKNNIPFPEAQLEIHPPTIREIGYLGEEVFFSSCDLLNFSKEKMFGDKDKVLLDNFTDFNILMAILLEENPVSKKSKKDLINFLNLIFPDYTPLLKEQAIYLYKKKQQVVRGVDNKDEKSFDIHSINNENFPIFKNMVSEIFCLKDIHGKDESYNPSSELAKKIANKLERGRAKAAAAKHQGEKTSILGLYVSILSVGLGKDMNELLDYTIYQLFDEFNRYELKVNFDMYVDAKMAGAKNVKEVDHWMKDIHS